MKVLLSGVLVIALMAVAGCKNNNNQTTTTSTTATVILKVHRVLAPGDTVGDSSNRGCRLTLSDIQTLVKDLQNNGAIFGGTVNFVWDQSIDELTDTEIPTLGTRTVALSDWFDPSRLIWLGSPWDTTRMNIYFVGNVQLDAAGVYPNYHSIAVSLCPGLFTNHSTNFTYGLPQSITVNDGGGEQVSGCLSGVTPDEVVTYHVMCHEMTHYLARCFDETIVDTGSIYYGPPPSHDDPGHDYSMYPAYPNNILRWGGCTAGFPYPLVVPGDSSASADSEQKRTWDRLKNNTWNSP